MPHQDVTHLPPPQRQDGGDEDSVGALVVVLGPFASCRPVGRDPGEEMTWEITVGACTTRGHSGVLLTMGSTLALILSPGYCEDKPYIKALQASMEQKGLDTGNVRSHWDTFVQ